MALEGHRGSDHGHPRDEDGWKADLADCTGDWIVEADCLSGAAGNILLMLLVLQNEKPNNSRPKGYGLRHPRPLFTDSVAESYCLSSSKSRHIAESKNSMSKSKKRRGSHASRCICFFAQRSNSLTKGPSPSKKFSKNFHPPICMYGPWDSSNVSSVTRSVSPS